MLCFQQSEERDTPAVSLHQLFHYTSGRLSPHWFRKILSNTPMRRACVQDIENISCSFCAYPVVTIKLGKVIKYEAKQIMLIIYLETLNIKWVTLTPKIIRWLIVKEMVRYLIMIDISLSPTLCLLSASTHFSSSPSLGLNLPSPRLSPPSSCWTLSSCPPSSC